MLPGKGKVTWNSWEIPQQLGHELGQEVGDFGSWGQFAAQGGLAQVQNQQWGQPAAPYQMPNPELKARIDKTVQAMCQSPTPGEFQAHLINKQGDNPDFRFLLLGGVGNDYFEAKKQEYQIPFAGDDPQLNTPFPPKIADKKKPSKEDFQKLRNFIKCISGTKEAIKSFSQWLFNMRDCISNVLDKLVQHMQEIDFNNFGRKLHICYVINDLLHECMKSRDPMRLDVLDPISNAILHQLPTILKSSFEGYSPQDQEKMHNLLTLWSDREIFNQEHINYVGNYMMMPDPWTQDQWGFDGGWGYPPPPPPANLLHLAPGFVIDILLNLFRTEDFPTFTPIPLSHVPPCMPERNPKTPQYILEKYDDFERAMEILDSRFRRSRSRSRSRSRERARRAGGYDRKRRRRFSNSPRRDSRSASSGSSSSSRSRSPGSPRRGRPRRGRPR